MFYSSFKSLDKKQIIALLLKSDLNTDNHKDIIIDNALYSSVYDVIVRNFHKINNIFVSNESYIELTFYDSNVMKVKDISKEIMREIYHIFFG